jgi:hypothetical protein
MRALWATLALAYLATTLVLIAYTARNLVPYGDWNIWVQVPARLAELRLYDHSDPAYTWVWSPLAAWLMAVVFLPLGPLAMAAMHFAVLLLIRDYRVILIVATSYPFWMDTLMANTFTFSAVAGYIAWRGNRWAALAYLALLVLMPRPVQLPLAALLVYRDRSLWLPFAGMLGIAVVTSVGPGYGLDWARALIGVGVEYPSQEFNFSPSRLIGLPWLIVGIPLAAWLTLRRHPGWAGLAVTPYLVPQYFLLLVWEAPMIRRLAVRLQDFFPSQASQVPESLPSPVGREG